jgi:hypothetical protein
MQKDQIIDTSGMTYDDIRPGVRYYIPYIASQTQNPNGTWSKSYAGEEHFKTNIGMLPVREWTPIARKVIEAAGDGILLDAIIEHVKGYGWDFKAYGGVETYAMECFLSGAYKAWEERGEFTPPAYVSFRKLLQEEQKTDAIP